MKNIIITKEDVDTSWKLKKDISEISWDYNILVEDLWDIKLNLNHSINIAWDFKTNAEVISLRLHAGWKIVCKKDVMSSHIRSEWDQFYWGEVFNSDLESWWNISIWWAVRQFGKLVAKKDIYVKKEILARSITFGHKLSGGNIICSWDITWNIKNKSKIYSDKNISSKWILKAYDFILTNYTSIHWIDEDTIWYIEAKEIITRKDFDPSHTENIRYDLLNWQAQDTTM
jgi:hypothetical protein